MATDNGEPQPQGPEPSAQFIPDHVANATKALSEATSDGNQFVPDHLANASQVLGETGSDSNQLTPEQQKANEIREKAIAYVDKRLDLTDPDGKPVSESVADIRIRAAKQEATSLIYDHYEARLAGKAVDPLAEDAAQLLSLRAQDLEYARSRSQLVTEEFLSRIYTGRDGKGNEFYQLAPTAEEAQARNIQRTDTVGEQPSLDKSSDQGAQKKLRDELQGLHDNNRLTQSNLTETVQNTPPISQNPSSGNQT